MNDATRLLDQIQKKEEIKHYIILTPPRSRSAWLANFMCWGPSFCFHEALPEVPRVHLLPNLFKNINYPIVGMVDNGAAAFSSKLVEAFPDAKFVVIRRPKEEVAKELLELNLGADDEFLDKIYSGLDLIIKERPETLQLEYKDISKNLITIWQHCIGTVPAAAELAFWARAMMLERLDVQLDMRKELDRLKFLDKNCESLFEHDFNPPIKER